MGQITDALEAKRKEDTTAAVQKGTADKAEDPGIYRRFDGEQLQDVTVVGEPGELPDLRSLLARRGMDLDDWVVERVVVNEWQSHAVVDGEWIGVTNHQLKATVKPKTAAGGLTLIQCNGPRILPPATPVTQERELIAFMSDHQATGPGLGYDPVLHELAMRWLDQNAPKRTIIGGDLINGNPGSRWTMRSLERNIGNQELAAGHAILHDVRTAVGPDAWIGLTGGNHEFHYLKSMRERHPDQADLYPAGDTNIAPLFSMRNLLQLDKLGITEAPKDYPFCQFMLTPKLAARHGWIARKDSGASGTATLMHLGYSIVIGHTHRQGITYHTSFEIDGPPRIICAVEAGTMCLVDENGQGYAPNPNWQPGFVGLHVRPNGTFSPSPATFVNGHLLWEDQDYWMDARGSIRVAA